MRIQMQHYRERKVQMKIIYVIAAIFLNFVCVVNGEVIFQHHHRELSIEKYITFPYDKIDVTYISCLDCTILRLLIMDKKGRIINITNEFRDIYDNTGQVVLKEERFINVEAYEGVNFEELKMKYQRNGDKLAIKKPVYKKRVIATENELKKLQEYLVDLYLFIVLKKDEMPQIESINQYFMSKHILRLRREIYGWHNK